MKNPVLRTRKEVVSAIICAYPGGRIQAAEQLGLGLKKFDNHAYEAARPLTDVQLRQLELQTGTTHLPEYIAALYGGMFVRVTEKDDLDTVELYAMSVNVSTRRGAVDQEIAQALQDGVITTEEADTILQKHNRHMAARHAEVLAAIQLFSKRSEVVA
ncbi:YmfL family putative regulatory protein [Pseudomonas sp. KCJK8993]|uniref:YmfL family putative regulatory protein n=1 Tax=Pseudomonas sp. KCJK8993 TaxID=3344565 RepID=UPI003905DD0D